MDEKKCLDGNACSCTAKKAYFSLRSHAQQQTKKMNSLVADKRTLDSMDFVPPNAHITSQQASLFVCEDNEAVIKMVIRSRSPTMRHVSRTHRVDLGVVV